MKRKSILLLIIGCLTLATTITGLIMIIIGMGTYNTTFVIGLYMFALSVIICIPCMADAIRIFKTAKREDQEIQEYSNEQTVETTVENDLIQVIKEAIADNPKEESANKKEVKYCSNCGHAIDRNSNFCKICGKEQE